MRVKFILALALAALIVFGPVPCGANPSAAGQAQRKAQRQKAARYECPMHPEVTSRRPGKCPKCGMALRPAKNNGPAQTAGAVAVEASPPAEGAAEASALRIPDATVYNQNGRRLNFYTDLVKGKVVAINFIFTTCTTICPPLTATFRRVQSELGEHVGRDIELISVSVDPVTDTPERLFDFAAKFKAGPGWTFVTGDQAEIDSLLQAFGVAVANKNDHTPTILIGNDATGHWTRAYGLASPTTLVKAITEAAGYK
ncbi:MAG TPA: SCO family protein [Pyrinomonadaceae bacterium]|jgi:cytochrome oxidase Cu insertion factor (SCO1/SenC/PrrC family)